MTIIREKQFLQDCGSTNERNISFRGQGNFARFVQIRNLDKCVFFSSEVPPLASTNKPSNS